MWLLLTGLLLSVEVPYDGIDQDGDGVDLVDQDGDGFVSVLAGGSDCNDRDAKVHPGAADLTDDDVDQDCGQPLLAHASDWESPWDTPSLPSTDP